MTSIITISASYDITTTGTADLSPKTWADVKEWHIKWDRLYVFFEGETSCQEFDLNSEQNGGADFKRPRCAEVFAGDWDEEELASFDTFLDSYGN